MKKKFFFFSTLIAIVILAGGIFLLRYQPSIPVPEEEQTEEMSYRLPLSFEVNHGQADSRVKFLSRGHGYTLFLTSDEAVFALSRSSEEENKFRTEAALIPLEPDDSQPSESAVIRMKILDANPNAQAVGAEQLLGRSNYFIGNDPEKWYTDILHYS
ncbi:hypothetical protein IID24_02625, partial [Patescibacteria group bacterium]|nr:hypothetical protein [Patescibacteria group bacterium]